MKDKVVILVFTNKGKILVEKRKLEQFKTSQYLIPGGTVKDLEKLEQALMREAKEELGIKLLEFSIIPHQEITGLNGQLLKPFLIHKWEGKIPDIILDKGNPLSWVEFDEALTSQVTPTRKVVEALKEYLNS